MYTHMFLHASPYTYTHVRRALMLYALTVYMSWIAYYIDRRVNIDKNTRDILMY